MSWSVFNWMLTGMLLRAVAFSLCSALFSLVLCLVKLPGEAVLVSLDPSSISSTQRNHCALPRFFLHHSSPDCFSRMLPSYLEQSWVHFIDSSLSVTVVLQCRISFCPVSSMSLCRMFCRSCFRWQDKSDRSYSILARSCSPYFLN